MPQLLSRGDVWLTDFDPIRGHEQAGRRPAVIVSSDAFNRSGARLIVVLPLTSRFRNNPLHIEVNPPEGGLRQRSFAKCEDVRSLSTDRLVDHWGSLKPITLSLVEETLRMLLEL